MHQQAALVTGGATRLGRYFSEALADAGYDIALHVNRSRVEAEEVARGIRAKGRECEIFHCDFLSENVDTELSDLIHAAKKSLSWS